jgi:hypothetical protein
MLAYELSIKVGFPLFEYNEGSCNAQQEEPLATPTADRGKCSNFWEVSHGSRY